MNNFYPIVGIAGKAGSGKTTTATFLSNSYNGCSIALADPIKRALLNGGGSKTDLWGPSVNRNKPFIHNGLISITSLHLDFEINAYDAETAYNRFMEMPFDSPIRDLLKCFGSVIRNINRKHWIDLAMDKAQLILDQCYGYDKTLGLQRYINQPKDYVIIEDIRFRNELLQVKQAGGLVIKLVGATDNKDTHVSETELDTVPDHWFNAIVYNDGDLATLYYKLHTIMEIAYGDDRGLTV